MSAENSYNDKVVTQFAVMTIVWGIVGMLVGVIIAAQLAWPALNSIINTIKGIFFIIFPCQRLH